MRNNDRGRQFIAEVVAAFPCFIDSPCPEQEAISELLLTPKVRDSTQIQRQARSDHEALLDPHCMNALGGHPWGAQSDSLWQEGSFIAQFHGLKNRKTRSWQVQMMRDMAARF